MEEYPYPLTVEGPWPSTSTKTLTSKLQIYFQSRKKSQGGDCTVKICEQSGGATVLFKSEEIRDQVLAKGNHSINIDNQVVKLKVFKSSDAEYQTQTASGAVAEESDVATSFQQSVGAEESDPKDESSKELLANPPQSSAVVLEKLPNYFSRDTLALLVENISDLPEDEFDLEIIMESNCTVVTFKNPSVSEKFLLESRNNKKIQKYGIMSRALEKSRSIKVESLPNQASKDLLELYFEKWGGAVETITMIPEEQTAIVTFHSHNGVQKVLGKEHHIGQTSVNVYPYFASLGTALYGKDRPTWSLPKPFTEKIHPALNQFLHKKGFISSICDQMSSYFCEVNMDKAEVQLSPLPTLLKQKGLTKTQIDGWKQNALDGFRTILSNYAVFEHAVMPSMWATAEKDIRSVVKEKALMMMDGGLLTLAGMAQDINLLKPILEDFLKKALNQMERDKNTVSESMEISAAMLSLLLQEGLQHSALDKYPELKHSHRKDTNQLTLQGLSVEVVDVKNWILERRLKMKQKTLNMDASLLEFLRSADCDEMSGDLFTSKGISSVYKVEHEDVVLMGSTDSALAEAEKRLHVMLQSRTLSLEDQAVLEKPEWRSLRNNLSDTYNSSRKKTVIIVPSRNGDTLVVSGFMDPVSEVSSNLEMFIKKHSRIEKVIRVKSFAVLTFIIEKKSEAWAKFVNPNEVRVQFDPRRPLIRLSGERVHVQPVMENFQKIAQSLHTDRLTIKKAGAKKFFQEQRAMFMIMIKEDRFVIVLEEGHMLEEDEDEDQYDSDRLDDPGQLSCKVQMPDGVTITVRKADICQLKVDAVVNAANEDLKHIGGLALALLKAAGPTLQEDSDRYVAVNGKVQPGNAITTGAGRLPCRYVVHAVGPRYSATDKFTAVKRLRKAVRESLNQAVEKNCSSIAVPTISSGVFGFPLELCSETIAKELYAYVEDQSRQGGRRLTEIHLVDNNASTVNAMVQAVRKEFADFNPEMIFPEQRRSYVASNRGHGNRGKTYRGRGNHRGKSSQSRGAYGHQGAGQWSNEPEDYRANESMETEAQGGLKRPSANQLSRTLSDDFSRSGLLEEQFTQEGLRILLRKGNIQDATSDVIVNTIAVDGNLSSGAVSKALLGAAGPQLQSEASSHLDSFGSSKLSYGDIVVTGGYNLNCRRVFHAVCPFWNGGSGSESEALKQIIEDCLKKAEQQRMTSVSFPALGTGNLRFPKDLVSSILLREIHDFSAKFTPRDLREVTVVVHPSDNETVQCFIKSFRGGKPGPITKSAQASQQPSHSKSHSKSSQSPGLFGAVSTPTLGVHRVQVGHLTLEVSSGDITKERIDAIVNSSNSSFTLKAGVSKAILDAAGSTVELECAQAVLRSQLQQNECIVTSGGRLPCKHIIHVIGRNTAAAIKDVVYSVLKLCETQKFSSVAFPALGTGQGGISPSAVADAMIDAVIEFVKKKKGQHLQSVKFLIFQTSMVSDFYQTMLKRQQEGVEEETTVIGWLKGKFDAVTSYFSGSGPEASANEDFVMVEEEFEPAVFQLCGESQQDLNKARDLITSFIVKEHSSSPVRDSAINHFTREDAETLSSLQRELAVSIQLNKSGPEPVITVEGLTRDVMKVESTIRDMIRKVEKNESRKREAFMVGSMVEWQYLDSRNKLVAFDYLTNYDLEEAFGQKQPRIKIKINNEPYEADIPRKTANGKNGMIELKRVDRRVDKTSVPLPSHWEDMKGSFVKRVQIQPGTQEYTDVENQFRKTGLNNKIVEIERVQNSTLWRSYMIQKNHLDEKNKHKNNEKMLFHGTGADNIDKIDQQGFNRSYAGMHGAAYGNGAYFAVDPNYSRGYAKPDRLRQMRMYLAKVLVGDYTTGKAGLLSPPAKSSGSADLYDSVTDNQQNPSMFVIFHDVQAYPDYLITFQ